MRRFWDRTRCLTDFVLGVWYRQTTVLLLVLLMMVVGDLFVQPQPSACQFYLQLPMPPVAFP